jgi:hypothetical protein
LSTRGKGKSKGRGERRERRPARPLAEYKERIAAEQARPPREQISLKRRIGRLFPLLGIIGVPELGLMITVISAIVFIWAKPHLWTVGLVLTIAGLLITRYGAGWLSK